MIVFCIAAALLLAGLIVGVFFMKRQGTQAELVKQQSDINVLLENVYSLGEQQKTNMLALHDTVQRYADDETKMLEKLTSSANDLGAMDDPARLQHTAQNASKALQALYAVARYYPPLVSARSFLEEEEAANSCENALARSIERYNSAVTAYNARMNGKEQAGVEPLHLIMP